MKCAKRDVRAVFFCIVALSLSFLQGLACAPVTPPVQTDSGSSGATSIAGTSVASSGTNAPIPTLVANVPRAELLTAADISGLEIVPREGQVVLSSARNEWVSFLVRVNAPASTESQQATTLSIPAFVSGNQRIDASRVRAYQLLPVPVDVNRGAFVRHTGLRAKVASLPRALLPLTIDSGQVDLAQLRDPSRPADKTRKGLSTPQPLYIWIDIHIPIETTSGRYSTTLALAQTRLPQPLATLGINIDVADFVLSDERHLNMSGALDWDTLKRLWPEQFEVIRPALFNRDEPNHQAAVRTLDRLMTIAQEHRVQLSIPRLQPTVKWPANQPVRVDWRDHDSVVAPWLSGEAFADKVPLGYWPLPKIDFLDNIPAAARLEYYASAAAHFDGRDWLRFAPVILTKPMPGRTTVAERLLLSAEASSIFSAHPRVRVMLPLELDEVQVAPPDGGSATMVSRVATSRLHCVAPGLISTSPLQKWPPEISRPQSWLRTGDSGLIPYVGAGADEGDFAVWAWMAFLRNATIITWDKCLPITKTLGDPADPADPVWFYPGQWFGTPDQIVPTVQLKWLRRAQQDYEYLYLARERGSQLSVLPMARVLTKPVEIQPNQSPDVLYNLLIGTADAQAWRDARVLLTGIIQSKGPGITTNENAVAELNMQTLRWIEPLEKPAILPRVTQWSVGNPPAGEVGPWVNLLLGVDLYNASDTTPDQNQLQIDRPVPGWEVQPVPLLIPKLNMYQVTRHKLLARIDPARTRVNSRPVGIAYRSGFTGINTPLQVVAPVSRVTRRIVPLTINGSLDDWGADDAIQTGPLVRMLNRPAIQSHTLESAATNTEIYSGFSESDLYVSFRVDGLAPAGNVLAARNFIDYQSRRAWSEDLCQLVMQAVYEDGVTGPLVHVALKPGGNLWVERKVDERLNVQPWQSFNAAVRYAATLDGSVWRGELAVPWASLINPDKDAELARQGKPNLPVMLTFNFIQHRRDTGESASWAGPLDSGRDDPFTGVLMLKEPE